MESSLGKQNLQAVFDPQSVVLIGSSRIDEELGMTSPELFKNIENNMKKYFQGEFSVIDIETAEPSLTEVDMAIIVLPPQESMEWAQMVMETGIKAIIQITGGFPQDLKLEYLDLAMQYHTRVLGPNTIMGIVNTSIGLNTTFEPDLMPSKGNISVISQSGGVGAALLDWASYYKIGISKFVFTGDKLDVDDANILKYFLEDPDTRVIAMYLEGLKNGRRFVEITKDITQTKPIVVLKGGITEESAQRALSHTASIAGSDEIFNAAFNEAGIIRTHDIEELFNTAMALVNQPVMKGKNVVILSNVGGPAILAADAIAYNGLELTHLSKETKQKINAKYPGIEAINPLDIIADARADRFRDVLELVLEDPNVHGVMVINMLKSCFFKPEDASVIPEVAARFDKPVVDVPIGADDFIQVNNVLRETPIPCYDLPDKAAKALKALYDYGLIRQ
jgi:acyl-CoA synthetase (NDP forming)